MHSMTDRADQPSESAATSPPAAPRGLAALARALRHRNYRLFMLGQGISLIGTWMQQTALAWLVFELTGSSLMLGVVAFAGQIPTFFIAPVAGVFSDHFSRRGTLLVTQSVAMLQALALVALLWRGSLQVWQILGLSVVLGVANAFDLPTRQAFVVDMVPHRADLPNAIALNSSLVNASRLVGPFAAGLMLAAGGAIVCFLCNAISFLAVIVAYLSMRDLPTRVPPVGHRFRAGLAEGVRYAFGFTPIRALLMLMAVVSMMGMPMSVLLPAVASETLHGGPQLYGFLTGATGLGALTSALYLASRNTVLGLGKQIAWSLAGLGGAMIAFAWSRSVPLSFALLMVSGFSLMLTMAGCNTLLQTIVDEDKRGRVMSFYTMSFMGTAPLGSLLAGSVAEHFGIPVALMLGGSSCIVGSLVFGWHLPQLREKVRPIYRRAGILPELATAVSTTAELSTPPQEPG
jgi:MFS family permease